MEAKQSLSEQEIIERLERGETLFLDDQWFTYISKDPNGGYIARSTARYPEQQRAKELKGRPVYEEVHHDSVHEALLAQLDDVHSDSAAALLAQLSFEWHDYTTP